MEKPVVTLSNNTSDNHLERNTPKSRRNGSWDRLTHIPADHLAWLWLLVGFVLLPFNLYQSVIWVAAWLAPSSGARVVTWQESAAWVLEEDQSDMLDRVETLARNYNATLLISVEVFTHATSMPYLYNQSILIDPSGKVLWVYDKTHVVPFDEAFITIGGPGLLPVVDSSYGRLSTAICYDTYYPALLRQAGEKDTDIFYAPTHDISVWASSALAMADYRTIENGFTMIRPTGNGISAVIDNRGRILASQDYSSNSAGLMLAELPVHAGVQTIYSQIGDAFAYLCIAGLAFLIGWALLQRKQPTPIAKSQPVVSQEIHHVE